MVAPIVGGSLAWLGTEHWQIAAYFIPALVALIGVFLVLFFLKKRPYEEGLPTVEEVYHEESVNTHLASHLKDNPELLNSREIFIRYVLKNQNSWYLVGVDIFTYMVRFGMLTWIPLYILTVKGFTKADMSISFMLFEWAAIPSTLVAGWLVDKFFKGKVMYLPMICLVVVFLCVFGYMSSDSILFITLFSTVTGCLIYIPQSMVAVQAMEVIPSFALGYCSRFKRIYELYRWFNLRYNFIWFYGG